MGWWDSFYSIYNALDDAIWYIESQLESWVQSWAYWAINMVGTTYDILAHSWDDVKDYAVSAAASAYEMLDDKIEEARDYAKDKADEAYNKAVKKIGDLEGYARGKADEAYNKAVSKVNDVASDLYNVQTSLNTSITNLGGRIDSLAGTVGDIDIPGAATIRAWLATDFLDIKKIAKDYTDSIRSELLVALKSADNIAGAARAKLLTDLKAVVKKVETDALKARASIKSSLDSAITALENSSKAAREVLEKSLNKAMDTLEREAKEAREVIEGSLIQIIEEIEDALERAITDLERTFRGLLDVVIDRVGVLEGWVDNATKWFDTEINKYQSRIVTWIVEGFEGILDRVFK